MFIEFEPRPTYAHNSSFSPPAEIIMMMVIIMIDAELMIIITSWWQVPKSADFSLMLASVLHEGALNQDAIEG